MKYLIKIYNYFKLIVKVRLLFFVFLISFCFNALGQVENAFYFVKATLKNGNEAEQNVSVDILSDSWPKSISFSSPTLITTGIPRSILLLSKWPNSSFVYDYVYPNVFNPPSENSVLKVYIDNPIVLYPYSFAGNIADSLRFSTSRLFYENGKSCSLRLKRSTGVWESLTGVVLNGGKGKITRKSLKDIISYDELFVDLEIRAFKTLLNDTETYNRSIVRFYDKPKITTSTNIICQGSFIYLNGGYENVSTNAASDNTYISDLQYKVKGGGWTSISTALRKSTTLSYGGIFKYINRSYYGQEIQIRPFRMFGTDSIIGNTISVSFLPIANITLINPPTIKCHGGSVDNLIFRCDALPKDGADTIGGVKPQLQVTIYQYLNKPLAGESESTYQKYIYPENGLTYYYKAGSTFMLELANATGNTYELTKAQMGKFGFGAGLYKVTAKFNTTTANCSKDNYFLVTEPNPLQATISNPTVATYGSKTYNVQTGAANGNITTTITGGSPPYAYVFDLKDTTKAAISPVVKSVSAGVAHFITVYDNNNCTVPTQKDSLIAPNAFDITSSSKNVSCNSSSTTNTILTNDGSVSLKVNGGVPPYKVTLTKTNTIKTDKLENFGDSTKFYSLSVDTYNLTVTDSTKASWSTNIGVDQPTVLSLNSTITNPTCAGGNNGSITGLSASGGTGTLAVTYGGNSVQDEKISNLVQDTYSIVVTDKNTCTNTFTKMLVDPPALNLSKISTTNASCTDTSNGTAILKLEYSRKIDGISFGSNAFERYCFPTSTDTLFRIKNLSNGAHTITVTDGNSCNKDADVNINLRSPGLGLASSTTTAAPCSGKGGEVTLTASNGEGNYTFTVDGKASVQLKKDSIQKYSLKSGIEHTLSVSDGICAVTIPNANVGIISNPITLNTLSASDITAAHCASSATGAITISRKTGTGVGVYENTTYSISPSTGTASGGTFSNLYTGHYTITAEDDSLCVTTSPEIEVPVSPNTLTITHTQTPAACEGESPTGTLTVKNNGTGFGIIRFSVDTLITATHGFPGTEFLFKNLYSGNHTLYAQDGSGCAAQIIGNVEFNSNPVSLYAYITHQTCNETSDASIKISANTKTVGTAQQFKFTYNGKQTGWLTDTTYKVQKAGNYSFTVKDRDNCGTSKDTIVTNLGKKPLLQLSRYDSLACLTIKKPNGGLWLQVDSAKAPSAPYTYSLNKIEKKGKNASTRINYDNLDKTIHRVIVQDKLGCKDSVEYTIPITRNPVHITRIDTINANCVAAQNGKATIRATSYKPADYTFICHNNTLTGNNVTFTNLPVNYNNSHAVKVIDVFGCEYDSAFVTRTRQDTLFLSFIGLVNAACPRSSDGSINVKRIRGNADYNFLVKTDKDTVQRFTNNINDVLVSGLPANTYSVVVTDKDYCRAELSEKVVIGEPDTIRFLNNSWNYIKRKGDAEGYARAQIWKGNDKYNYHWLHLPDSTTLKKGQITNTDKLNFVNLKAGRYLLQVQDTAKCWVNSRGWLEKEYNIVEPDTALDLVLVSNKAVSCHGLSDAQIQVKALGGWHTGQSYLYGLSLNTMSTSPSFANLRIGTVKVYVKDTSGTVSYLPVEISQPDRLSANVASILDANCYGNADGSIDLAITGGNYPHYSVSTDSANWKKGSSLSTLSKGVYTAYVADTFGCHTSIKNITIGQPDDIWVSSSLIKESRCGYNNGRITAEISGGMPDYHYQWSSVDNAVKSVDARRIDSLMSGVYQLAVTDTHNCLRTFSFNVSDSTNLTIDKITTIPVSCWGYEDGRASIKLSKGNPPYTVTWPDSTHQMEVGGLATGTHNVRVDDKEKCKLFKDFNIGTPDRIGIESYTFRDPYCEGVPDGSITVAAIGSFGDYRYAWDNGQTGATAKNLEPGTYKVRVTDSHTCFNQFEYSLKYQQTIHPSLGRDLALCAGNTAVVTTTTPYKGYKWTSDNNFSAIDAKVTLEKAGHYYVEVTDFDDCIGRDTLNITQSVAPLTGKLLVASQVQQMDTVMIFETSWPIPDSVKFDLPGASLLAFGTYYREVVYADTGTYKVGLTAYLHDCFDYVGSDITVVPRQANNTLKSGKASLFNQIKVYPNPSSGPLSVELMLSKKADVTVKLANLETGIIINERQLKGFDRYSINYDLHVPCGSYLLYFQSGNESKTKTIIIR